MKIAASILLAFLLTPGPTVTAQPDYFRSWQVKDGISSNYIGCILQDSHGFMWFGTRSGLNRFDGAIFRQFRHEAGNPGSIGSNSILSLAEDVTGKLWVGTHAGLYVYDPHTEKFSLFKKAPLSEIRYITRAADNRMWFVLGDQLYSYDPLTDRLIPWLKTGESASAPTMDDNGLVWYATGAGIVHQYNAAAGTFTDYPIPRMQGDSFAGYIQVLRPIGDSAVLIATQQQVLLLDKKDRRITNVFARYPWANHVKVYKIMRQSANIYWFGSEDGLYILDLATGEARLVRKQLGDPYSINDNVITAFCKDREGGTWVGTFFGGVNYYSSQLNLFRKDFPIPGTNSLTGNLVHEICMDKNDHLWVGTEDAGLNKLDLQTGRFTHFLPDNRPGSITYRNIHGLAADGDTLWIGTYDHGLDLLDLRTEKVVRHFEENSLPGSLRGNFVITIYRTRANEMLVGTWAGLFRYDRKRHDFTPLPYFQRQVQCVLEDEAGTLWVGSYGGGVYYYNPLTGIKGSFHHDPQDSSTICDNYVNNLFEDSQKNIWIATENGLCLLDRNSHRILRFPSDPILKGSQVFKVLQDSADRLWISTSNGLVCMDPGHHTTRTFTTDFGLLSNQFNYNSGFRDKRGNFYFGTLKGLISFRPSTIVSDSTIPPVYITGLQVNNTDLISGSPGSRLPLAIPFTNSITLPYDSSSLNIQVAALSYTIPDMNSYQYKMEGLDKEWVEIKTLRKIYYTKLPPGDYLFKVKGSAAGVVWNEKVTTLAIHITPPPWATPWAWVFYVLVVLGILLTILRYYYMALREKDQRKLKTLEIEQQRQIYNAKIEFFTQITHEIRTPLTLIRLPVEKLLKSRPDDSSLQIQLNMINKNTHRLIHLTDQLLDFRRAEANNYVLNFVRTDINALLKEIFDAHHPSAEEKKRSFRLEMPRVALLAYVDPEAMRKILDNLFSNAIKYAENNITVQLLPFSSEDQFFYIECRNDGLVIPPDLEEKIFEPFYRLKQTEKYPGTGIGLSLARSLAELHNGKLELKQTGEEGNRFSLILPIHQQHGIDLDEMAVVGSGSEAPEESLQTTEDPDHVSILIVEDNKEIAGFLQQELHEKFNVRKAWNGQEALAILNRENIQLVISDIMMPVMDGIELCRTMKTDVRYSHIPIILLTAKNTLKSRIEGLDTGADAYIEKPFEFEHLLAQLNNLLHNRHIIKEYYAHSPLVHIKGIASNRVDTGFLQNLQQMIDANITNMDLHVDELAKMMHMSRGTFYRKIKGLSNLTPNELITVSRLKKAAELLAKGEYKITEVANIVGYQQSSNFSRDFSRQFGMSPSAYVKSLAE